MPHRLSFREEQTIKEILKTLNAVGEFVRGNGIPYNLYIPALLSHIVQFVPHPRDQKTFVKLLMIEWNLDPMDFSGAEGKEILTTALAQIEDEES